ncbi:hypothetical protein MZI62_27055, partial [Escherichia coli]|nr:hypothetical protein [Escherichia coli]
SDLSVNINTVLASRLQKTCQNLTHRTMPPATERWHFFVLFVSYFAITMMNIAICETIITVVLYSSKGALWLFQ